jgi:hypothetical protein
MECARPRYNGRDMNKPAKDKRPAKVLKISDPASLGLSVLSTPPLLQTENSEEFALLLKALRREIKPRGVIEELYLSDITCICWEILRYRRCKVALINSAYFDALKIILHQLSRTSSSFPELAWPNQTNDEDRKLADLAFDWFRTKKAKEEITHLLKEFQLDESVIEGQAVRAVLKELNWVENMLINLEIRRDRFLRQLEMYREVFVRRVRSSADRVIDAQVEELPTPRMKSIQNSAA